ncbi:hypothetical protein ACHFCA_08165 [Delftia tsuruhatensis]
MTATSSAANTSSTGTRTTAPSSSPSMPGTSKPCDAEEAASDMAPPSSQLPLEPPPP